MAQHVEGAALIDLVADAVEEHRLCGCAVGLGQRLPRLRLGLLHPCYQIRGEEGTGAVVVGSIAFGMEPAMGGEVGADFHLEADLLVDAHGYPETPHDMASQTKES